MVRVEGVVTRGTTAPRRLRRADRWITAQHVGLLRTPDLLVVDLGFGAAAATTLELARRIRCVNPTARIVGLDVDAVRVAQAGRHAGEGVTFGVGGFELAGLRPHLVRAFNVLRQYDEGAVPDAWQRLRAGLAPGGVLLDGTCDESGRLGSWVSLDADGPRSLTLAADLRLPPSTLATRLPKALIHRNVPGEPIHRLLVDLDRAWRSRAALSAFGSAQRFAAAVADLRSQGWPLLDGPRRWRRGEATVTWAAVAPLGG
jgi:hypothetical protein